MKNKKLVIFLSLVLLFFCSIFIYNKSSYSELKIAQLTDIHFSNENNDNKPDSDAERLLNDAIEQINDEPKIDFTIITGDLVNVPDEKTFRYVVRIFNNLHKPWYYVLGNHDRNCYKEIPREPILKIVKEENKNGMTDKRYYSFKPKKGYTFIGLDGSDYGFDDEQIAYLEGVIDSNPKEVIVIFVHTPVKADIEEIKDHVAWNSDKVIKLLNSYKQPIIILAGHYHATKIIRDNNVLHVTSPSLRYAQEFRIIDMKNYKDKVVLNFDYKGTKIQELNSEHKERFPGEYSDKFAQITIEKIN